MTVKCSCFTYKRDIEITAKNTQKGKERPTCMQTVLRVCISFAHVAVLKPPLYFILSCT